MKRIIGYIISFLVVFNIALLVFFPYTRVVEYFLNKVILETKIDLRYSELKSSPFGTSLYNVEFNVPSVGYIPLGDVNISYSPLSVLTKSVKVKGESNYADYNIKMFGSKVNGAIDLHIADVGRLFKVDVGGESALLTGEYDLTAKNGALNISGSNIYYLMFGSRVNAATVNGTASFANSILTIEKFETTGDAALNATGQIKTAIPINRSVININGEMNFMGMKSRISVSGTAGNLNARLI